MLTKSRIGRVTLILVAAIFVRAEAGEFIGSLKLEDVAGSPGDEWHSEFKLIEDYSYKDNDGVIRTAPAETIVNGASIPKAIWGIFGGPWSGKYRNASVIHDWMCQDRTEPSDLTHEIFYDALIDSGVKKSTAGTMYYAVYYFGPEWTVGASDFNSAYEEVNEEELKNVRDILIMKENEGKNISANDVLSIRR